MGTITHTNKSRSTNVTAIKHSHISNLKWRPRTKFRFRNTQQKKWTNTQLHRFVERFAIWNATDNSVFRQYINNTLYSSFFVRCIHFGIFWAAIIQILCDRQCHFILSYEKFDWSVWTSITIDTLLSGPTSAICLEITTIHRSFLTSNASHWLDKKGGEIYYRCFFGFILYLVLDIF